MLISISNYEALVWHVHLSMQFRVANISLLFGHTPYMAGRSGASCVTKFKCAIIWGKSGQTFNQTRSMHDRICSSHYTVSIVLIMF